MYFSGIFSYFFFYRYRDVLHTFLPLTVGGFLNFLLNVYVCTFPKGLRWEKGPVEEEWVCGNWSIYV